MPDTPRPAPGGTAILLIDVLNALDFKGAEALRDAMEGIVDPILRLRDAADTAGVPVIYCNDNHGEWRSERGSLVDRIAGGDHLGSDLARRLCPRDGDYFVIKPRFSAFYATSLPVLLPQLRVSRLILAGVAADICVQFTAADAHMREYDLWVPADTTGGEEEQRTRWALEIMRNAMHADVRRTDELSLAEWLDAGDG